MRAQYRASGRPHPGLLQAIQTISPHPLLPQPAEFTESDRPQASVPPRQTSDGRRKPAGATSRQAEREARQQDLLHRARAEDVLHWQLFHRPISAETLRKWLRVGTGTARALVTQMRRDTGAAVDGRSPPSSTS